ncbi:2-phosphoglycerate kinase [Heracleum sosnowskyi]|uniref:2-phosphoglycerate kinase n=1 Tax=Heracleum sosnowskyi TaxID=360622 RepID=A0AAD8H717_9APIA|nr:2-phosphoglycerate kinase [Heracleum sosnowskyi]
MKKEKGVALGSNASSRSYDEFEYKEEEKLNIPAVPFSTRNASSKYDFVKVKVWLGDNADHYYVLSRFLLSRMLTVTKIPNHVALKIALELKKLLIDNSLLDVSQSDLEANLFKLMERRGYGEEYINRYKMMTRFHHQRVPLVILVCGTACVGKSTIATQLAQRLNLPNVLQTGMVYELLRTSTDAPLSSSPVWARHFSTPEELITEFCRECRIVRKGLAGDLKKAMKDGKPIIIEGMHLDPSIYLMDDENKTPTNVSAKLDEQRFAEAVEQNATQVANDSIAPASYNHHSFADELNMVIDGLQSVDLAESARDDKDSGADRNTLVKKEKSSGAAAAPIIVPIVLKMAEFDHKALLEEWIATRSFSDNYPLQDKDKLISNLKTIQDYLCSFTSQGLTVANISATTFPQTLDWLHSYLLQCIEQGGTSSVSSGNVKVTPQKQSTG